MAQNMARFAMSRQAVFMANHAIPKNSIIRHKTQKRSRHMSKGPVSLKKRPIPLNNLAQLRDRRGWSMQKLGEMIGKDASYINKLEKYAQGIPVDVLQLLARALDVQITDIVVDEEAALRDPRINPSMHNIGAETTMIPIYGTAAGSHLQGAVQMLDGPIDQVEAPKALKNAKGIYGLYVVGHSMEPMFRHGGFLAVSTYKPPRPGDAVIAQEQKTENSPREATIGILERISADRILLKKLNPPTVIELNAKYVVSLHKVLDHGELLGVS
jgi:transcriptional regulator with XRE-family HTH domain